MGHNYNKILLSAFLHAQKRGEMTHCEMASIHELKAVLIINGPVN